MPKMIACYEGFRFVAGVDLGRLHGYMKMNELPGKGSYLGMCKALVNLEPDVLKTLGGFSVVLSAGQVVYIPGGVLIAECPISRSNTIAHWTTLTPAQLSQASASALKYLADLTWKLIKADLQASPDDHNSETLRKLMAQTEMSAHLLEWAGGREPAPAPSFAPETKSEDAKKPKSLPLPKQSKPESQPEPLLKKKKSKSKSKSEPEQQAEQEPEKQMTSKAEANSAKSEKPSKEETDIKDGVSSPKPNVRLMSPPNTCSLEEELDKELTKLQEEAACLTPYQVMFREKPLQ